MKKLVLFLSFMLVLFFNFKVHAEENWVKEAEFGGLSKKTDGIYNVPVKIKGDFKFIGNVPGHKCRWWEADSVLEFNFSEIYERYKDTGNFDVNHLYLGYINDSGQEALEILLDANEVHGHGRVIATFDGKGDSEENIANWKDQKVGTCVGVKAKADLLLALANPEQIYMWYDGPNPTCPTPPSQPPNLPTQTIKQSLDDHDENFGSSTPTPYTETTRTITEEDLKFKVTTPYEIDHHRKKFVPNQDSLNFKTKVKNTGSHTPPSGTEIKVYLYRSNGSEPDNDPKKMAGPVVFNRHTLDPGEQISVFFDEIDAPSSEGTYNYQVRVKIYNDSRSFKFNQWSDPMVFEVTKPDLYFTEASFDGHKTEFAYGEEINFYTYVKNGYIQPDSHDITVAYEIDGQRISETNNMKDHNLEPEDDPKKETLKLTFGTDLASGQHYIRAIVDSQNEEAEKNEGNNTYDVFFTIKEPAPAYPYQLAYSLTAENTEINDNYFYTAINPVDTVEEGQDIHFIVKLINVNQTVQYKAVIEYNDGYNTYSWDSTWDKFTVNNNWEYSFYHYKQESAEVGTYTFKFYELEQSGNEALAQKTVVVKPKELYQFANATTADDFVLNQNGTDHEIVNQRSVYTIGETMKGLIQFKNLYTDHEILCDISWRAKKENDWQYWWTAYGGWQDVSAMQGYSYLPVEQIGNTPGYYQFKVKINTGNETVTVGSFETYVESEDPYFYMDTKTAKDIWYDESIWTWKLIDETSQFTHSEPIRAIVTIADITINHQIEADIYYDGYYSWTATGSWNDVNGYWGISQLPIWIDATTSDWITLDIFVHDGVERKYLDTIVVDII